MTKSILLPVDPDEKVSWQKALPEAVDLARHRGATLHVMTVVPDFGSSIVATYFPANFEKQAQAKARSELETLAKNEIPNDVSLQLIVAHGRIYQEICKAADAIEADLIIMASHKPEVSDVLLAPNAAQVLHHTARSVMIVR